LGANDATNTLTASHSLGTTEILVSENNGSYAAYTAQILVGNVARPIGYWKFKTRAAPQRNESLVVNSPEFTVTTTPVAPVLLANDSTNTLSASHALGTSEILVSENNGAFLPYSTMIIVGDVAQPAGYWKFKTRAAAQRNESPVVLSPEFTVTTVINTTPAAPVLSANDSVNILSASHALGISEIIVSENNGIYTAYAGQFSIGNVLRPVGYWKFKIKAAPGRNESSVSGSPAFTITTTPTAPVLSANDSANTLTASHSLGTSEILVSENNGAYIAYSGQISLGNVATPAGYWKFKIKATAGRNESAVSNSPAFTISTMPAPPALSANDSTNTLSAAHTLGSSEILVSENNGTYIAYAGQISIGNVLRPIGYWKFKIKAAPGRYESIVTNSPAFTIATVVNLTPDAPVLSANDSANTLIASHALGTSEILVSENNGAYTSYVGEIKVTNISRSAGYWKFKIKAVTGRNESSIAHSPAFTMATVVNLNPDAPVLSANDSANTLIASHALGTSEILVSENNGAYTSYIGEIKVTNISRSAGYWKFKIKAATGRNESSIANSPAFTVTTSTVAPALLANDVTNTLSASHALGTAEILVSVNNGMYIAYTGDITVGNLARAAGYWKFKIKASYNRYESPVSNSPAFTISTTPAAPEVSANDAANNLSASHTLGTSEILVSENNGTYTSYSGSIKVGNVAKPMGYWKFKIKAAAGRNESSVANSPAFTDKNSNSLSTNSTTAAPEVSANDVVNSLTVTHSSRSATILVSENNGAYKAYSGQINVGNTTRGEGYWKFKTKANGNVKESSIAKSPAFTINTTSAFSVNTTSASPAISANDSANTLSASHTSGTSNILVSENNAAFKAYSSQINVGNVARPQGYWKFKMKAAPSTEEGPVVSSPAFTVRTSAGRSERSFAASSEVALADTSDTAAIVLSTSESKEPAITTITAKVPAIQIDAIQVTGMKAADTLAEIQPKNVSFIKATKERERFVVYPNPIISKNIFIQCSNIPEGVYAVSLVSLTGQIIVKKSIHHSGGTLSHSISVSPDLSKGVYLLQFSGKDILFNKQLLK
jgi:uncharacterized membrane protein